MVTQHVIFSATQIHTRVRELARQIDHVYRDDGTIHIIGVLRGAFVFTSDLVRALTTPTTIDFAQVSSYEDGTESRGHVTWRLIPDHVEARHTLIVEDIVDTGRTLEALRAHLLAQRPASLRVVSLLSKRRRRQRPVSIDFTGFEIDDVFAVGYGLDLAGKYRELPHLAIGCVNPAPPSNDSP